MLQVHYANFEVHFQKHRQRKVDELTLLLDAHKAAAPELERQRAQAFTQYEMRDAREDLADAVDEGHLTPQQAIEIRKRALTMGEAGTEYIYDAVEAAENGKLEAFLTKRAEVTLVPEKVTELTGAPGEIQTPGKVAVPEKGTPEGAEAWKKAFEAQRKSKQQQEDEALIRQIESDEYAEPDEDGDPGELFFSKKADEEERPWWYSPVEKVLQGTNIKKQSGRQWKGWLSGQEGVKKDELEHSGMNDFLDLIGDMPIEKSELLHHMKKFGVGLEEEQLVDESLPEEPEERHEALMQHPEYARLHNLAGEVAHYLEQGRAELAALTKEYEDIAYTQNISPLGHDAREAKHDELLDKIDETNKALKEGSELYDNLIARRNTVEDNIVLSLPRAAQHRRFTYRGGKDYRELLLKLPQEKGEDAKFVEPIHFDDPDVLAFVRGNTRASHDPSLKELTNVWDRRLHRSEPGTLSRH